MYFMESLVSFIGSLEKDERFLCKRILYMAMKRYNGFSGISKNKRKNAVTADSVAAVVVVAVVGSLLQ